MEKKVFLLQLCCFLLLPVLHGGLIGTFGTKDKMEEWGYVRVRPKAHMFWWLYRSPYRTNSTAPWPIILWLQGGPGSSGVAFGNFLEMGPLDTDLQPRNSTWLRKADLLFVDSPVGTGYSFVEENSLAASSDEEVAADLTTLLIKLFNRNAALQSSPLYIVAESYGGKHAALLGLAAYDAIKARKLKMKLGGVVLGDSWISPEDFVLSWGPLLKDVSRLNLKAAEESNRFKTGAFDSLPSYDLMEDAIAIQIQETIRKGQYTDALNLWASLEQFIIENSNNVDMYNFMIDYFEDPLSTTTMNTLTYARTGRYMRYLGVEHQSLSQFMNTVVRQKLRIIPRNIQWGAQADIVMSLLSNDFMKHRISEVDDLLQRGVQVTIYNGQLDLICATKGTEAWVQKLKWEGLKGFLSQNRTPLYCGSEETNGFHTSYQNLAFYWILNAGHFVPVDQPCLALKMIGDITNSPAS